MALAGDEEMIVVAHEGESHDPHGILLLPPFENPNNELVESLGWLKEVDTEEGSLGDLGENFAFGAR